MLLQAELRRELKRKQNQRMEQLKRHGTDIKDVESDIYVNSCNLEVSVKETQHLRKVLNQNCVKHVESITIYM